jgi:hypothetical protein
MKMALARTLALACLPLFATSLAYAQATRTWVSGVGDDVNPCSRTAPCKTFAGAISKTAPGGEIDALDPAGYGAVTITKAITINGGGSLASALAGAGNGIVVNAGPNDVVTLRNLEIVSVTPPNQGTNGINFLAGARLHVENVIVRQFGLSGLLFQPSGVSSLYVVNSVFTDSLNGGIDIIPTGAGTARAQLRNVVVNGNGRGVRAESGTTLSITDSTISGNVNNGLVIVSGAASVDALIERVASVNNGATGVRADGATANLRISNCTVSGNATGLFTSGGGNIRSFQNNAVSGNTTDGSPTGILIGM